MSGAVLISATAGGGLTVSLSPLVAIGVGNGTVTTNQSVVSTVAGGAAPYTYLWTSFDPDIFPVTPSQSFSFFRRNDVQPGDSYSATVQLTVTDAAGQVVSAQASVNISGL